MYKARVASSSRARVGYFFALSLVIVLDIYLYILDNRSVSDNRLTEVVPCHKSAQSTHWHSC